MVGVGLPPAAIALGELTTLLGYARMRQAFFIATINVWVPVILKISGIATVWKIIVLIRQVEDPVCAFMQEGLRGVSRSQDGRPAILASQVVEDDPHFDVQAPLLPAGRRFIKLAYLVRLSLKRYPLVAAGPYSRSQ